MKFKFMGIWVVGFLTEVVFWERERKVTDRDICVYRYIHIHKHAHIHNKKSILVLGINLIGCRVLWSGCWRMLELILQTGIVVKWGLSVIFPQNISIFEMKSYSSMKIPCRIQIDPQNHLKHGFSSVSWSIFRSRARLRCCVEFFVV